MLAGRAQFKYQFPKAQIRKTYYSFFSHIWSLYGQSVCVKGKQSIYTDSAVSEIAACGGFTKNTLEKLFQCGDN